MTRCLVLSSSCSRSLSSSSHSWWEGQGDVVCIFVSWRRAYICIHLNPFVSSVVVFLCFVLEKPLFLFFSGSSLPLFFFLCFKKTVRTWSSYWISESVPSGVKRNVFEGVKCTRVMYFWRSQVYPCYVLLKELCTFLKESSVPVLCKE